MLNGIRKDKTLLRYVIYVVLIMFLASCQSFGSEDVSITLESQMTAFATESAMIQQTSQIEQTDAVETLQASGTTVANAANVNVVLAATVKVNIVPTPVRQEVIVNPDDMGDSLDSEMMEEEDNFEVSGETEIRNVGTARSVRASDGCSNGNVTQFTDNDERIYLTAQVSNLTSGINFSVDWVFEERLIYRTAWTSDYSASSECIWFFMTPEDAPFLPGLYTATLFINGSTASSQQFSINTG